MALRDGKRFLEPEPRSHFAIPQAEAQPPLKKIDTDALIKQKHEDDLRTAEALRDSQR